jgi:bifunctional UDP-N-acetylglucosamine pyrophosphorylase/glucosamine-1-phosphate N-acetyltransferase
LLVVVLAAGNGRRMKSSTPKALHPLAGEPLIAYPLALARQLGAASIVIVHSPGLEESLHAICDGCILVAQREAHGTGHALNQVPHGLREADEVLVLLGDVPLLTVSTARSLLATRRRRDVECAVLASRVADPTGYGRVILDNGKARIVEEADASPEEAQGNLVNTGVACFSGPALWRALKSLKRSTVTGEIYLTDIFARIPGRAVLECVEEEAMGVNDRAQLAAAEAIARHRINRAHMDAGVTMIDPASTYIDAGVRIEPDVTINPFCFLRGRTVVGTGSVIGPFAELDDTRVGRDCVVGRSHLAGCTLEDGVRIGPFNRVREGSVLARGARIGSFAEIKNTLVGPDSDVHHFSYLGDAVLGRGVNIGAGAVTANYDGEKKNQTRIGDGVFVGVDTVLIAPVSLGDRSYTAAGSVVNRDVPPDNLAIERSELRQVADWSKRKPRRKSTRSA